MKKQMKHVLTMFLLVAMLTSLVACGAPEGDTAEGEQSGAAQSEQSDTKETESESSDSDDAVEEIELSVFTHLPDRTTGLGLLEQTVFDQYTAENPHVKLKIEALEGETYKQKITAYLSSNELPDLFNAWGSSTFFDPITTNGYAAELNIEDFEDYNFIPGSLDGFMKDGKLYGLPKILDFMVLYYNEDLLASNNVEVPGTWEDIIESVPAFREAGLSPVSFDGRDGWPLGVLLQEILVKQTGNQQLIYDIVDQKVDVTTSEEFLKAAATLQDITANNVFQDSYLSADYGAALNLFGQEKAAMYYMGSWEVGLAKSEAYSESFRENVAVMPVPGFEDGEGSIENLLCWYGGGFAVSEHSENKEEAIKMLKFIMQPEVWAKAAWQTGIAMPAQEFSGYFTGDETQMQKDVVAILENGVDTSGTVWIDYSSPSFKTDVMNLTQELAVGVISPEEYVEGIAKAIEDR